MPGQTGSDGGVLGPLILLSLFQNSDSHIGGALGPLLLALFQNSGSHMGGPVPIPWDIRAKNVPKNEKVSKIRLFCDHDLSLIVELSRASDYNENYNSPIV